MKRDTLSRGFRLRMASVLSAIFGVLAMFAISELAQRSQAEEEARQALLYDATIAASMFNADLRVAEMTVESVRATRAAASPEECLSAVAVRVSGAVNAYLLDDAGRVLATAFDRRSPHLTVPSGFTRLMAMHAGVAIADAEGGYVVVLVASVGPDRSVAVLFRAFPSQGHFITLLAGRGGRMYIQDALGGTVRVAGSFFSEPPASDRIPPLVARFSLPSFPLTVVVGMDGTSALKDWTRSHWWGVGIITALLSIVMIMFIYGNSLLKRGLEAERLESQLAQKEVLYRETNHRVKNNLAIVQGILRLSASEAACGDAGASVLEAAASRVESIALLHDTLNRLPMGSGVDLDAYLGRLLEIVSSVAQTGNRVRVETSLATGMAVDPEVAVPCGLIVNELVTNAIKYAFPGDRRGRILVSAEVDAGGTVTLGVVDDGIGYDPDKQSGQGGIGTQLVALLGEQLHARSVRDTTDGGGCAWSFVFTPAPKKG